VKGRLIFILCLLCFATSYSYAQNLVPNPSFEEYTECPASNITNLIELAIGWHSFRGSPNYFNDCVNESFSLWDVPKNGFGTQLPYSGSGYAGLYTYGNPDGGSANYREFIGAQLMQSLILNTKYFVSFRVVRATNGFYYDAGWANNKIGILLSMDSIYSFTSDNLNNFANIHTDSIISDTLFWQTITGSFIADSAYEFISIGNFFDAINTNAVSYGTASLGAYYYIDDVCLSTDSSYCLNWTYSGEEIKNSSVKIFPNPSDDYLYIDDIHSLYVRAEIINLLGEKVLSENISMESKLYVKNIPSGIYNILLYSNKTKIYCSKILINH
jgi:hypothetical protein